MWSGRHQPTTNHQPPTNSSHTSHGGNMLYGGRAKASVKRWTANRRIHAMARVTQQQQQELVERVLAEVRKQAKGPLVKSAVEYARLYYRHVPASDMVPAEPADLAAAALESLAL